MEAESIVEDVKPRSRPRGSIRFAAHAYSIAARHGE